MLNSGVLILKTSGDRYVNFENADHTLFVPVHRHRSGLPPEKPMPVIGVVVPIKTITLDWFKKQMRGATALSAMDPNLSKITYKMPCSHYWIRPDDDTDFNNVADCLQKTDIDDLDQRCQANLISVLGREFSIPDRSNSMHFKGTRARFTSVGNMDFTTMVKDREAMIRTRMVESHELGDIYSYFQGERPSMVSQAYK